MHKLSAILGKIEGDVIASIPMPDNVKRYVERKHRLPL